MGWGGTTSKTSRQEQEIQGEKKKRRGKEKRTQEFKPNDNYSRLPTHTHRSSQTLCARESHPTLPKTLHSVVPASLMDVPPQHRQQVKWLQLVLALAQQVPLGSFGPIRQPSALSWPLGSTDTADLFHALQSKPSSDPQGPPVFPTDTLQLQARNTNAQGGCP